MRGSAMLRGIWRWAISLPLALLLLSVATADLQAAPFAYIGNYSDGTVSVIDTATNAVITTVTVGGAPAGVAVHPDGTRVYITKQGTSDISVIDTATNSVSATISLGGPNVTGIAVSPDGTRAYAVAYHPVYGLGQIAVINTTTNMEIWPRLTVGGGPNGVAVSPNGTRAYVANQYSGTVSVIDTTTTPNTVVATVSVGSGAGWPTADAIGIAVNPLGTRVYVTNRDSNKVSVIDTATNAVTATVAAAAGPLGIAINPTGTRAYVTNAGANTLSVIDTATNTVMLTVPVGVYPTGVDVNPMGTMVYVANWSSNNVSIIDTNTNGVIGTIAVGNRPIALGKFITGAPTNQPPVADAGPDQVVECTVPGGTAVTLDGTESSDPDDDPLTYLWTGAFGSASGATPLS